MQNNKLDLIKNEVQAWLDKQGHDQCWFYPEILQKIVDILEIKATIDPNLPTEEQFKEGCKVFCLEKYKK